MAAKGAERIATRALADHHHIQMIFGLYRQHVPAVFHIGELRHSRLLIQHFIIIHHHIFNEADGGIAGIDNLKDAAPGEVLHRLEKENRGAEQQPQRIHFPPARRRLRLAAYRNDAERKDKHGQQIVVPRENGQDLGGLFEVGGMQRQQRIEVRRAVGLAKRIVHGRQQRIDADQHFLRARKAAPQKMQHAGKSKGIEQAKVVAQRQVNKQRL